MKKTKLVLIVLMANILFINVLIAATFTEPSKIIFIGVYQLNNIGIQLENSNIENPAECANTTSATKLYKIIDTTEHGKNMYSLALASKASGVNVKLVINETACTSEGYAIINGIVSLQY